MFDNTLAYLPSWLNHEFRKCCYYLLTRNSNNKLLQRFFYLIPPDSFHKFSWGVHITEVNVVVVVE